MTTMNNDWDLTPEQENKVSEFFDSNQWIVAPGREDEDELGCYYWENFSEALKFHEENPDTHIYTILEAEGNAYIVNGARYVNRFAYLIGLGHVDIKEEIRLW